MFADVLDRCCDVDEDGIHHVGNSEFGLPARPTLDDFYDDEWDKLFDSENENDLPGYQPEQVISEKAS